MTARDRWREDFEASPTREADFGTMSGVPLDAVYGPEDTEHPGQYPYTDGLTVPKAVATAGGFTYRANQRKVFIKRGDHPAEEAFQLTPETMVAPGDIIRIGERFF